ncbi:MAG: hypothetical protein DYH13_04685 [Alphaproteobacteria bacterium PRO2]|nr:hypothetical protein [Alphaproteobacteria bacterium PRO2]
MRPYVLEARASVFQRSIFLSIETEARRKLMFLFLLKMKKWIYDLSRMDYVYLPLQKAGIVFMNT